MKPEHLETALTMVKNIEAGEWIEVIETTKWVYIMYIMIKVIALLIKITQLNIKHICLFLFLLLNKILLQKFINTFIYNNKFSYDLFFIFF